MPYQIKDLITATLIIVASIVLCGEYGTRTGIAIGWLAIALNDWSKYS